MIFIPLLALVLGVVVGLIIGVPMSGFAAVYLPIVVIAGLDAVCGGWRSALEGKFQTDVFLTGFVANTVIASFLAFLGDRIGVDLFFAAAIVLGWRIFTNLNQVRRIMLSQFREARRQRS